MESVWKQVRMPEFPELEGDHHTDVLIIGGGIAGIMTAYYLRQSGVDCMVVERGRICSGNTGNTTAKITAQHGLIYSRIAEEYGLEGAAAYYRANMEAVEEYARLSEKIDCDFQRKNSYVYSLNNRQKLEEEMTVLQKIGSEAELRESVPLPLSTVGAVCFPDQAQFHPLRFLGEIAKELPVFERSFVRELAGCTAVTDRGRIRAERVICATHFPFINKHGGFFLKLYQSRSYVLALDNAQDVEGMYVDEQDGGLSFRNENDLLLLGGGGGRTGKPNGGWEPLRSFAREKYPSSAERFFWAAQDCISLDGLPYVGRYSRTTPNLYVASGFNKWGMTGAMTAAMLLRDQLLGKDNPLAPLYNPSRTVLHRQLLINGGEAMKDYIPMSPKLCPHLGCALKWNSAEHSWDCPCHGSRFTEGGILLDNPANGDLPTT